MCAVTHRAKPYQLALLIKKSLDDAIVIQQSDTSKNCVFYINCKSKLPLHVSFELLPYIPLQCKSIQGGSSHWLRLPTRNRRVGNTNILVSKNSSRPNATPPPPLTQREAPLTQHDPPPPPQHEPMEYSSHWVCEDWIRVRHVHFMLFVSISFALGSQRERVFQWNMGFIL